MTSIEVTDGENSLLDVENYSNVDSSIVNVDGEEYNVSFNEQDGVLSINDQDVTNEDIENVNVIVDGEEFNVNVIEGFIPENVTEGSWQPWDSSQPCPAGFTCTSMGDNSLGAFSCDEMARLAVDDFGFGNVLAGISCPEGRTGVYNCPVGSYCPNSSTVMECPVGLFCPYKTYTPTFVGGAETCQRCPAGSETKHLSRKQRIAQGVVFGFLLLILIIKMCMRKASISNELLKKRLHFDSVRTRGGEKSEVKRKQEMYTRLRPKLEVIAERLGRLRGDLPLAQDRQLHQSVGKTTKDRRRSAVPVSPKHASKEILYVSKAGDIIFDANAFFDVLDQNNDGVLSYSEINAVLCLEDEQLRAFIATMRRKMSSTDGNDGRTTMGTVRQDDKVSRATFVKCFLDALADASHFQPTSEEADEMFTRIAGEVGLTKAGAIEYDRLYASSLSTFLTDMQIYGIIQRFKRKRGEQNSTTWGSISRFTLAQHLDGVSRYDFVKFYPQFLSEVCQPDSTFTYMSMRGDELAPAPEGLDVTFENLYLTVKVGKKEINVVNNVTGRLRSNTMTAVMGGSGSGKSSLLNALCGRASYGKVTGTISINGNDSLIEEHKAVIGFVPQEDIVYPDLTVRENLLFAGRLYLPKGTSETEIAELADTTMASLGLSRIANSLVGDARRRGVSGGEKKRVNVGIELMKKPRILFLDEPTSGLDSRSAFVVMESLARLCSQGMTVASVIHQPRTDIYDMFDSLFLLGVGGHTVYHGPATEARSYFESLGFRLKDGDSQADWFLDISSGDVESESGDIEAGSPSHDGSMRRTESHTITDGSISFEVALQNDHGIGFEVEKERDQFVVTKVGSVRYVFSADHFLLVGDMIVGVNGIGTKSLSMDELTDLLNQQPDTITSDGTLFGPMFIQVKRKQQEGLPPLVVGYEENAPADIQSNGADQTQEKMHLLSDKPANEEGAMLNAKQAREKLYRQWALNFDNILPAKKDEFYSPPKAFELPTPPRSVPGWRQLLVQLRRHSILSYRNRDSKLIDFGIIVIAVFAMTLLGGVDPGSFSSGIPEFLWIKWISSPEDASQMLPLAFAYSFQGVNVWTNYAMMVGLIVSVLMGLNATKVITEKRLEFYREAQAGADVTQYFIAATFWATLEQGIVSVACSGLAYLVLKPSSVYTVYLWNFIMLSWLSVGWALLLAVIVPLSSVSTVVGFFNAFFGLLFCGKVQPGTYRSLYANDALAIFSAYFSNLRFFVEGMAVSEAKCLPSQAGYTVADDAFNYPIFEEKYPYWLDLTFMAHTDMGNAIVQDCGGWFWWVPAAIVVGIVIRLLGIVAIHLSDRPNQGKKPIREEISSDFKECRDGTKPLCQSFILKGFIVVILFVGVFAVSCWLILRQSPMTAELS